jgi:hypothetical protein
MKADGDRPYHWLTFPGAELKLSLQPRSQERRASIVIAGNRSGLLSLGNLLLALSTFSSDTESVSLTGLPYARVGDVLALTVVQSLDDRVLGRLVRMDHGSQYCWNTSAEHLEQEALNILAVAYTEDGYAPDHVHACLDDESDADILIVRQPREW